MKRKTNLVAALLAGVMVLADLNPVAARVTASAADNDIWCVGPSGAEVCADSTGGFVPTTTNDADLGTSSLKWKALHITAGGITDAAIDTADIATDAVTAAKMITNAVETSKIKSDSVTTAKLINSAVETAKIATDAVTAAKIMNGAVETAKLLSGAVDTYKISGIRPAATDSGKIVCVASGNLSRFGLCTGPVDGAGGCTCVSQ